MVRRRGGSEASGLTSRASHLAPRPPSGACGWGERGLGRAWPWPGTGVLQCQSHILPGWWNPLSPPAPPLCPRRSCARSRDTRGAPECSRRRCWWSCPRTARSGKWAPPTTARGPGLCRGHPGWTWWGACTPHSASAAAARRARWNPRPRKEKRCSDCQAPESRRRTSPSSLPPARSGEWGLPTVRKPVFPTRDTFRGSL